MSLPDAYVGARHTGYTVTWLRGDKGHLPYDLTGATITAHIQDRSGQVVISTGGIDLVDADAGEFTWLPSDDDLTTPGTYLVSFRATYVDTTFDLSVPKSWKVLASF